MTQSYLRSGLSGFFKKRVSKVYFPYFMVTLLWVIIDFLIGVEHSRSSTVLTLLGINLKGYYDKTMWYITYILIWYLIFYIVFRCIKKDSIRISVLFIISIIAYKYINIFPVAVGAKLYLFNFPLGVLLGLSYKKLISIEDNKFLKYNTIIIIISLIIFLVTRQNFNTLQAYAVESLFFAIASIGIFGILSTYSLKSKILNFMGSISYEIYLFEGVFFNNYRFIFNMPVNVWIQRFVLLGLVIILGLLLQKVIVSINKVISS